MSLALLVAGQGQAGAFPPTTVLPIIVAAGGNVAATSRLGAMTLNPANAARARGIEIGIVSYPQTGLEGTSLALAGGRRVTLALGVWSFALRDIVDDDLVEIDPSLQELKASSFGATFGMAVAHGHLGLGILASHRAQTIVGVNSSAASVSVGARVETRRFEVGASLIDIPLGSPDRDIAPRRAAVAGVAATLTPSATIQTRVEVNAYAPGAKASDASYGAGVAIRIGSFEVISGQSSATGWGVGTAFTWQRWRVEAATSLVSPGLLNKRIAFSVTYR